MKNKSQNPLTSTVDAWLVLMAIHGPSGNGGSEPQKRNRNTWNRYVLSSVDEKYRKALLAFPGIDSGDFQTLSDEDRFEIRQIFETKAGENTSLPNLETSFIDLSRKRFTESLSLDGYIFPAMISFRECEFCQSADFTDAIFLSWADFTHATFRGVASFDGARFCKKSSFAYSVFVSAANFESAQFLKGGDLNDICFESEANFEDCLFASKTSFQVSIFSSEPPRFFGAKLHEGMIWRNVRWPIPGTADTAESFLEAYERLKLEMDRLKKHEDEIMFYKYELRCRRIMYGPYKGFLIDLYGLFSDYRISYLRPTFIMMFTILLAQSYFPWTSTSITVAPLHSSFRLSTYSQYLVLGASFSRRILLPAFQEYLSLFQLCRLLWAAHAYFF